MPSCASACPFRSGRVHGRDPADAILKFKTNFDDAYVYGSKPESERTMEKPLEFEARHDCRAGTATRTPRRTRGSSVS